MSKPGHRCNRSSVTTIQNALCVICVLSVTTTAAGVSACQCNLLSLANIRHRCQEQHCCRTSYHTHNPSMFQCSRHMEPSRIRQPILSHPHTKYVPIHENPAALR